jgi:hypothetical protein
MPDNLKRLAPLSGVVFFVIAVVAVFSSKTSPNAGSGGAKVIAFYTAHSSGQKFSDIAFVVAFALFLLFAGAVYSALRAESGGAATTALVGAGVMTAGFGFLSVVDYTLASHPAQLTVATAQVLNNLDNGGYPMAAAGALVFGLGIGFAILNSSPLPRWLGYVAIVLGILAATPVGVFALLGLLLWSLVVSILLYVRTGRATAPHAAPVVPATAL